ncbi:hypothetical protein SISNIDRAFT_481557 [Sistotremastrum niveocremeum HHB9708]|uniref:Uncharacterized protein n=1 Tax=Sistotremastrum niveocremeum HHB9708 TaxID=1314777 RepID=A0A164ZE88_9AGAM|nr:hypothetical protein SISNIDRAFT_481557 [Sistotremastrum niveocremeum HHB9708]
MNVPTSRELELETLCRQRDKQIHALKDEVNTLRQYLAKQPGPSTSEAFSLPPTWLSFLHPLIRSAAESQMPQPGSASASSKSVTTALIQRVKLLQDENDELYNMLRHGEVGKLHEELAALRKVVARLETALSESHNVINSLSTELNASYETIHAFGAARDHETEPSASPQRKPKRESTSQSPAPSQYSLSNPSSSTHATSQARAPPTGPRAHKKPRLGGPEDAHSPPAKVPSNREHSPRKETQRSTDGRHENHRSTNGASSNPTSGKVKMEVDDAMPTRPRSSSRTHDRTRPRDRERERDAGRDRDRGRHNERDRTRDRGHKNGVTRRGHHSGHTDSTSQDTNTIALGFCLAVVFAIHNIARRNCISITNISGNGM